MGTWMTLMGRMNKDFFSATQRKENEYNLHAKAQRVRIKTIDYIRRKNFASQKKNTNGNTDDADGTDEQRFFFCYAEIGE